MFKPHFLRDALRSSLHSCVFLLMPVLLAACNKQDDSSDGGKVPAPTSTTFADSTHGATLLPSQHDTGQTDTGLAYKTTASPTGMRPNILVILADDLGYSDIGAFGGEIDTPNLDALAAQGRVLTNFHTGAKCQVTRSQLLTGTEHHLIGQGTMGSNPNDPRFGKPGYENYLNDSALTFVQLLNDAGYHTYMSGKWQLGGSASKGDEGESPGGRRPHGWGFERTLIPSGGSHVHYIDPSNQTPGAEIEVFSKDGKYAAADYGGKSQYSADLFTRELIRQIDLDHGDKKPFFAYLAFNTPHVPMEAPVADLEKYKGRYKEGFNVVRENRIDKQKKLGIIPQDFTPTSLASKWKDLSPVQKQVFERRMQVYAAMVDNLDQNVGLIVQHLKEIGEYDNTFIVFQSDNGAPDSNDKFANITTEGDDLTLVITKLGRLGIGKLPEFRRSPEWASVSNTPFRGFKTELYEGGVSTPAIFVLPGQKEKLPALHEFAHVTDFAPTVLELAGVTPPSEQAQPDVVHVDAGQEGKLSKVLYQGKAVYPVTGTSLLGWLKGEKNGAIHSDPQVDEFDSQIYVNKGEWKALWQPLIIKKEKSTVEGWKLFNVASDRGETTALNANHPETLKELIEAWQDYAARVGVVSYGDVWPPKAADLK